MQSFIIIHQDKAKREKHLTKILVHEQISSFDVQRVIGDTSIGIEEIRHMQKTVFLTPVKSVKKAIVIEDAQTLTIEAQNALLKILEEPPIHALFFLSATSTDPLLPTILSRCSSIHLEENPLKLTSEEIQSLETDIALLLSDSVTKRLLLAEKIAREKDTITTWLNQAIVYLRTKMLTDLPTNSHLVLILNKLQEAYRLITTTNTNPRMVLEHTFLTEKNIFVLY